MEVERKNKSNSILMELYNGEKIRTPLLLSKALELIDTLPNSVELKENYIRFENQLNQQILFQRLFYDAWTLEINYLENSGLKRNLQYKHLRTRAVKAIVINFFYGIFIGTLDLGGETTIKQESRNQHLRKVINLVDMKLKKYSLCKYCGVKLPYILKENCEFCGVDLNFAEILLK